MRTLALALAFFLVQSIGSAQDMWKYFSPDDFAARRARVMEQIGDGIAILLAADNNEGYIQFRQDNNFYYLSGVEVPGAVLVLNGKTKTSVLMIPDIVPVDLKDEAIIKPGKEAAVQYKVSSVISKSAMTNYLLHFSQLGQPFYIVMAPEETIEMSRDRCLDLRAERLSDPWDGRIAKEVNFFNKLKERFPSLIIKDLTPVLDNMRWVKDDKEIAVLRVCGKIGALGFDEAMRVTKPGIFEYQVVASCDFVYKNAGAQFPAYYAIAASGERGLTWHYNANNHLMKDGDVILLDYAPDFNYYTTDITRTWPVGGTFTEVQLKMYNCIKDAEAQVIAAMKPGVTVSDLEKIAKAVYVKHGYEKLWPNYIGHFVGMSVHDVGPYDKPFVKGVVFNVEPIIEDKELKIHLRLEDTIVITATGSENLTAKTPVEHEQIYKLIREKGVGEK